MQLYEFRRKFKFFFILTAIVIAIVSVGVTDSLVKSLSREERKKIEIWAKSIELSAVQTSDSDVDKEAFNLYNQFLLYIVQSNSTIPLILADEEDNIIIHLNVELPSQNEETAFLAKKLKAFKSKNSPIVLTLEDGTNQYVYYDESKVLKRLYVFPYVQLLVVFVFIVISFLALSSTKKAEQNKVWVGLSKETAHQLGTPISSLMAWMELLRTQSIESSIVDEIDKDVYRLNMIADRFSKIGSNPDLQPMEVNEAVLKSVAYMKSRISPKVVIACKYTPEPVHALMNDSLFGWVVENLVKNAVDAMEGVGRINLSVQEEKKIVKIEVEDTGKGIPKSKFETVFHPGYTTKKRGWGLGLSLVRRIIESYGDGNIYILKSELGKGTVFRIELKKKKVS